MRNALLLGVVAVALQCCSGATPCTGAACPVDGGLPDLVLLVDTSGSMAAQSMDPNCTGTACTTRLDALKSGLGSFLADAGSVARLGLVTYPQVNVSDQCAGPTSSSVALPPPAPTDDLAAGQANAQEVNTRVQALTAQGGTPTGPALHYVASNGVIVDPARRRAVVLITDGLPNCNGNNPNNQCTAPNASCACTLSPTTSCIAAYCAKGCLDETGTLTELSQLADAGVRTFVVGLGAETASAVGVMSQLAIAGGTRRRCPQGTDQECGTGDACVATNCGIAYYQVNSDVQLRAAMDQIAAQAR